MEILETLDLGGTRVTLRRAGASDVPGIVGLLAADQLGATRDGMRRAEDLAVYQAAFEAIDRDPAHLLIVAQSGPDLVATMQLSFLPASPAAVPCGLRSRPSGSMGPTATAASVLPCSPGPSMKPGGGTARSCS